MLRIDHAYPYKGEIERRDRPYVGWPLPRSISRGNDSPVQLRKAQTAYARARTYMRAPAEYDIANSVFTSGTIGRDSVINTELVWRVLVRVHFGPPPRNEYEIRWKTFGNVAR